MSSNKEDIEKNYDRAIQQFQPGGFVTHGRQEVTSLWNNLRAVFPDALFNVEHVSFTEEKDQPIKAAIRWSLIGKHDGQGNF